MHIYRCLNAPMATTAASVKVTTGAAIKTMLQVATPATRQIQLISWGFSCSVAPGGVGVFELLETDVAATVTAHGATGVQPRVPGQPASLVTLGTTATGFTATVEGTTTASRSLGIHHIPQASDATDLTWHYQFMPDERPVIAVSKFLRIRATFATATDVSCWLIWDE